MSSKIITGDGRLHLAYPGHITIEPPGSLTPALATECGKAYDVFTGHPGTFQGQAAAFAAAGCEVGLYTKSNQLSDGSHPEAWYSHKLDSTGTVVRRKDGYWNVYPMEPSNTAWRDFHVTDTEALMAKIPEATVVFEDSAGSFSYTQGISPRAGEKGPLLPGSKIVYDKTTWLTKVRDNLDYWQGQMPAFRHVLNGMEVATVPLYTPTIGQIEGAFRSVSGTLPTLSQWQSDVKLILSGQAAGWTPWVFVKVPKWDVGYTDPFRALCVPTAYLCDMGSLVYGMTAMEGSAGAWTTLEHRHPWYNANLGPATSGIQYQGNTAYREFENGLVVVNPDTIPVGFTPPGGGAPITLANQTGGIYRKTVTWNPI